MDFEGRRVLCKVCLTQYARYTCPRCNLAYCSLPCYKQHNGSCTESFYRDQAVRELHSRRADPHQKKELLALLQRMQQLQVEDEATQQQLLRQLDKGEDEVASGDDDDDDDDDDDWLPDSSTQEPSGTVAGLRAQQHDQQLQESDADEESQEDGQDSGTDEEGHDSEGIGSSHERTVAMAHRPHIGERLPSSRRRAASARRAPRQAQGLGLSEATLQRLLRKAKQLGLENLEVDERDLTPEELARFHRALAAGQLSYLLPAWQPWWLAAEARELTLSNTGQRMVQEANTFPASLSSGQESVGAAQPVTETQLPAGPSKPLQPLSALTRAAPSPLLRYQLLELLYVYCFVMRRYNGDPAAADTLHEAAQTVLALSPALAQCAAAVARKPAVVTSHTTTQGSEATSAATVATVRQDAFTLTDSLQPCTAQTDVARSTETSAFHNSAGAGPIVTSNNKTVVDGMGSLQDPLSVPVPSSVPEALFNCIQAACLPPVGDLSTRPVAISVLADVQTIVEAGAACVVLALADLQALLLAALQNLSQAASLKPEGTAGRMRTAAANSNGHVSRNGALAETTAKESSKQDVGSQSGTDAAAAGRSSRQIGDSSNGVATTGRPLSARPVTKAAGSSKRVLTGAVNKLWFFMCWAHEHRADGMFNGQLAAAVQEEWSQHMQTLQASSHKPGAVQLPARS